MKIEFVKSNWEMGEHSLDAFMNRASHDGFHGVEVFIKCRNEAPAQIKELLNQHKLFLVGQIITSGETLEEQIQSFKTQFHCAIESGSRFINSQTGSDFLPFEDNVSLFQAANQLAQENNIPLYHETHRGKALYNLPDTLRYLQAVETLNLTGDFSHFMCVHESELRNRWELLEKTFPRVKHIHARVGFPEGPQVPHPLAPEWANLLEFYQKIWQTIIDIAKNSGENSITITPEAGPFPYMPIIPFSQAHISDPWQVNLAMKNHLTSTLKT